MIALHLTHDGYDAARALASQNLVKSRSEFEFFDQLLRGQSGKVEAARRGFDTALQVTAKRILTLINVNSLRSRCSDSDANERAIDDARDLARLMNALDRKHRASRM